MQELERLYTEESFSISAIFTASGDTEKSNRSGSPPNAAAAKPVRQTVAAGNHLRIVMAISFTIQLRGSLQNVG